MIECFYFRSGTSESCSSSNVRVIIASTFSSIAGTLLVILICCCLISRRHSNRQNARSATESATVNEAPETVVQEAPPYSSFCESLPRYSIISEISVLKPPSYEQVQAQLLSTSTSSSVNGYNNSTNFPATHSPTVAMMPEINNSQESIITRH